MPIFTAVNIDGPTWKAINRTTRQVTDPFESAETWYQDPRLDPTQQLAQADYDELSNFDRGHMVRREDAQWGVAETALAAMDDTFHFTNSCPQTQKFNRLNAFWQGIENYALNGMRRAPERISVFTGPIFRDGDPQRGALTLPVSFWKIVARVAADGRLRATGFIAAEAGDAAPLESLTSRDWPILPDEPVAHFQAQVTEIERRTGLRLPDELRGADTFGNHFEGIETESMRRIAHPEDASWG
jgi:endonuclease G